MKSYPIIGNRWRCLPLEVKYKSALFLLLFLSYYSPLLSHNNLPSVSIRFERVGGIRCAIMRCVRDLSHAPLLGKIGDQGGERR
jgi:hypothetical protein